MHSMSHAINQYLPQLAVNYYVSARLLISMLNRKAVQKITLTQTKALGGSARMSIYSVCLPVLQIEIYRFKT